MLPVKVFMINILVFAIVKVMIKTNIKQPDRCFGLQEPGFLESSKYPYYFTNYNCPVNRYAGPAGRYISSITMNNIKFNRTTEF